MRLDPSGSLAEKLPVLALKLSWALVSSRLRPLRLPSSGLSLTATTWMVLLRLGLVVSVPPFAVPPLSRRLVRLMVRDPAVGLSRLVFW